MASNATDPLSLVYAALWDLLESSPAWSSAVKVGNRIRFDGGEDKPEVTTADSPVLRIVPTGASPQLQWTSNGSKILLTYEVQIFTLDKRLDAELYPAVWETICAMARWAETLQALRWQDQPFVVYGRPTTAQTQGTAGEAGQRQSGWLDLWSYEVLCNFSTATMQAAAGHEE